MRNSLAVLPTWRWMCVAVTFVLVSCQEPPSISGPAGLRQAATTQHLPSDVVAPEPLAHDTLARAIAMGLGDPATRRQALSAWRTSPWVEHKLVLQEYLRTPAGGRLAERAGAAAGMTAAEFTAFADRFGPLDFYVLGRETRRSWRATEDISVGAGMNMSRPPSYAFSAIGEATPYASARRAAVPMVLLHPAEPKGRRMNPQGAAVGAVIQDADDGELAVQLIQRLPSGVVREIDLRRDARGRWQTWPRDGEVGILLDCGQESCDGGGGGTTPSYTKVSYIKTHNVCDMDCAAGNEFEFRGYGYSAGGSLLMTGTARVTGIEANNQPMTEGGFINPWYGSVPMIPMTVNGDGRYIDVNIVETDPWPNPDDNFDPNPFLSSTFDNGKYFYAGDTRLRVQYCASWEADCRELTVAFSW